MEAQRIDGWNTNIQKNRKNNNNNNSRKVKPIVFDWMEVSKQLNGSDKM